MPYNTIPADIQKMIDEYKQLSLENKKLRLLKIIELSGFEGINKVFGELKEVLKENEFIDDEFCVGSYQDIILLANNIKDYNQKNTMKSLQAKMASLKEREEKERLEENADGILDMLDDEPSTINKGKKTKGIFF